MTQDEAVESLTAYAERLIEVSKLTKMMNIGILPLFVTIDGTGATNLFGIDPALMGDHSRIVRFRQETAAAKGAIAALFFGDANLRTVSRTKIADALSATIETRDGVTLSVSCNYKTGPDGTIEFGPIQRRQSILATGGSFPPAQTH